VNGAPNAAPAPIAEPAAPPPAPVAIAPVDPLTFTEDMPEFPPAVRDALATKVDPSWCELRAVKEGSDRELLYVPWIHYQQVLVAAFGVGGFKLVPRSVPRTEGNTVTWVGALFVRIPGTSKFHFIKEAKGECNARLGPGNAAEGAESDCLTKCCKRLNIFMELYDPAWRAAWEKNYKGQHRRERAAAAWPAARQSGVAAPSAMGTESSPPSTEAGSPAGAAAEPARSETDTGEAATAEAKQAVAARLHELAWKWSFLREWVATHFGLKVDKPVRMLEALTQVQADAMLALLLAFNQPAVYQRLVGELRERGVVLR